VIYWKNFYPGYLSLYSDLAVGWTIWSSNLSRGKRFLSFPKHPFLLWGAASLLFHGPGDTLPSGKVSVRVWSWPLTTV